jgi:tetratricopeptide (TPR) repeat protein
MKIKILILLIVTLPFLNGLAQVNKSLGKLYLDDQQYNKARNFYQKLLKTTPNDVWVYCSLGDVYTGMEKLDSAGIMYQKAFTIDPKNIFALTGLGKIALQKGDRQSALDFFDKAKKMDRKNPAVYCKVGEACYNLPKKDTITGKSYLTQGMEINSKYAGFHMVYGDWDYYKKNYGKAANAYENAIFFEPNSILAYRRLGEIYAAAHFNRQAIDKFNKCIEIDPNQILVYKDLGELYYSLGRYPEAENNYKIYMGKAEVSLDDKEQYAFILFFNKKYPEAAGLLDNVLTKNFDETVLLRIRGYIAYETEDYKGGLDYMNKFFHLHNPSKIIPSDYLYYARLLEKNNMELLAMENYKKAYALDSTKIEILSNLARLSAKNLKHEQAILYYQKMIANGYDKVNSYTLIGIEAYFQGQTYKDKLDSMFRLQKKNGIPFSDSTIVRDSMRIWRQKADSAFTKVTELSPDYAAGFYWKGRMQAFLDPEAETTTGKEAYEKALAILEKGDLEKNRKFIMECYRYLGSNAYSNFFRLQKTDKQQAELLRNTAVDYFQKVLQLDPADALANEFMTELKRLDSQKPAPKKKK